MITVRLNGAPTTARPGASLADVLAGRDLPARGVAVAVDDEVVPRAAWAATALADGARVEILTAVQGG